MATLLEAHEPQALLPVRRHRMTVDEVLELDRSGFFDQRPRMELIEGELYDMAPVGPLHGSIVATLARALIRSLPEEITVWTQSAIELDDHTLPQPDFALVRTRADRYLTRHPGRGDIHAIIEVSDASLAYDRSLKARIYAAAGIANYWLFDLRHRTVIAHTDPATEGYRVVRECGENEALALEVLPGWTLELREVFPPAP